MIEYIRKTIQNEPDEPGEIINLADLIQFVTLKVSLWYIFGDRPGLNDRVAVKYAKLGRRIQTSQAPPHDHWQDPTKSSENPMNFILPAYETMWRAVFKGVLEIYFRDAQDALKWQSLLTTFLNHPTKGTFKLSDTSKNLPPKDVIKEVMRIYPPTRHVYRFFPGNPPGQFDKADIEKVHRLALLGQNNPESFRPERLLEIKQQYEQERKKNQNLRLSAFEESLGFFPVATWCPAGKEDTQGFGFKMVGSLVAALCEAFDGLNEKDKWKLQAASPADVLPSLGKVLNASGEDYLSLVYRKMKAEFVGITGAGLEESDMMEQENEDESGAGKEGEAEEEFGRIGTEKIEDGGVAIEAEEDV